jgi:hypothetical protein
LYIILLIILELLLILLIIYSFPYILRRIVLAGNIDY